VVGVYEVSDEGRRDAGRLYHDHSDSCHHVCYQLSQSLQSAGAETLASLLWPGVSSTTQMFSVYVVVSQLTTSSTVGNDPPVGQNGGYETCVI